MTKIETIEEFHDQLFDILAAIDAAFTSEGVPYFLGFGTALGAVRDNDLIPWDLDVDLLVPASAYEHACQALRAHLPPRYRLSMPADNPKYEVLFGRVHLSQLNHRFMHADLFPLAGTFKSEILQRVQLKASWLLRKSFRLKRRVRWNADKYSFRLRAAAKMMGWIPDRIWIWAFWRLVRLVPYDSARMRTSGAADYHFAKECLPASVFATPELVPVRGKKFPVPAPSAAYLSSLYGDFERRPSPEVQAAALRRFSQRYLPVLREVDLEYRQGDWDQR